MDVKFNAIEHFLNECEEAEFLEYKDCIIEQFFYPHEKCFLAIKVTACRVRACDISIVVELHKLSEDKMPELIGKQVNVYALRDFLKSFSYCGLTNRLNTTNRRKNNNLIFKFLRRNINSIIHKIDKSATGEFTVNSLGLSAKKEKEIKNKRQIECERI